VVFEIGDKSVDTADVAANGSLKNKEFLSIEIA
jgi:hypothetical protein